MSPPLDSLRRRPAREAGARWTDAGVEVLRPWGAIELASFPIEAGWHALTLDGGEDALAVADLWVRETGDFVSVTLSPGAPARLKLGGGMLEIGLRFGPRPDVHPVRDLRLTRLGAAERVRFFAERAGADLAAGDLPGLARRAKLALSTRTGFGAAAESGAGRGGPGAFAAREARRRGAPFDPAALEARARAFADARVRLESDRPDDPDLAQALRRSTVPVSGWSDPAFVLRCPEGARPLPDALLLMLEAFRERDAQAVFGDALVESACLARRPFDPADPTRPRPPALFRAEGPWRLGDCDPARVVHLPVPLFEEPPPPRRPWSPPPVPAPPRRRVSVLIPSRDKPDLLGPCLEGLLEKTRADDLEIVVIDNGSVDPRQRTLLERRAADPRVVVIRDDRPFNFSALCNRAAEIATGERLLLLNDDVWVREPDWLDRMLAAAEPEEVGVVGALLLYPDETIQHAGVALGPGGCAGHPLRGRPFAELKADATLAPAGRRSAVTAACMLVKTALWRRLGGMDERAFPVTLNDVDFCLRAEAAGASVVFEPSAVLWHLEGQSRPSDLAPERRAARAREIAAFRDRWPEAVRDDPWGSPALTRADESGDPR